MGPQSMRRGVITIQPPGQDMEAELLALLRIYYRRAEGLRRVMNIISNFQSTRGVSHMLTGGRANIRAERSQVRFSCGLDRQGLVASTSEAVPTIQNSPPHLALEDIFKQQLHAVELHVSYPLPRTP